jgi:hypothetical protein
MEVAPVRTFLDCAGAPVRRAIGAGAKAAAPATAERKKSDLRMILEGVPTEKILTCYMHPSIPRKQRNAYVQTFAFPGLGVSYLKRGFFGCSVSEKHNEEAFKRLEIHSYCLCASTQKGIYSKHLHKSYYY